MKILYDRSATNENHKQRQTVSNVGNVWARHGADRSDACRSIFPGDVWGSNPLRNEDCVAEWRGHSGQAGPLLRQASRPAGAAELGRRLTVGDQYRRSERTEVVDNKLTGSSGEHYVCYALARQGWAASLTRDGLQRTDILAVNTDSRRVVEIQVKAAVPVGTPSWMLGTRGLVPAESHHEWYVFVALTPSIDRAPTCYVVPRDHVAAATWIDIAGGRSVDARGQCHEHVPLKMRFGRYQPSRAEHPRRR